MIDLNKVNKYSGSMNGYNFNFRSSKVNCINGIGNVLNTLATSNGCKTTPFSFPNPTAALSSLVNAGKHALTIGIPGVFSALVCGLTDALNINKLASRLALPVSSSSDLNSLISMASLTTPGALIKSVPNLISSFSKKFSLSAPGITGGAGDFSSMIGSYDLLKPDWNIANTIGNGDITDLSSVMDASDDFYQTVISGIDSASNLTNISNIVLVFTKEVYKEITIPRHRVTAKPFIGPVPNNVNPTPPTKLVTCESKIVQNALL